MQETRKDGHAQTYGPDDGCSAFPERPKESIFLTEWLAGGRPRNQLPISAVCNSRCIFCSNRLNPFPIATGIFRDMEDIRLQLSLMPFHPEPIRMSDSLPGRIAEGEAFLHPRIFEILTLVRRKYVGNPISFTTNASMLDEPFLRELARFRPVQINVSLHSTQPERWVRIFRKTAKEAETAIRALPLIRKNRMELQGTIVPLPAICGWEDIEKTYAYFMEHGTASMTLYWPGYTVCSPPEVMREVACPLEEFTAFAARMRARFNSVPLSAYPEMKAPLPIPVKRIMAQTLRGNLRARGGPFARVLWLTSEAAHPRLEAMVAAHAPSFPNQHRVVPVPNLTYGGNIMAAGLLMVEDFIAAGRQALADWPGADLVLVPRVPFDRLNRDLKKMPAHGIAEALGKPVWLVDDSGMVDTLLSRLFFPEGSSPFSSLQDAMNRFHAAFLEGKAEVTGSDLVEAYPVKTSWGDLDREGLRERLLQEHQRTPPGRKPLFQGFEELDDIRALCIERWPTRDETVTYRRWTFLLKREGKWRVQEIRQGTDEDLMSQHPAGEAPTAPMTHPAPAIGQPGEKF